MPLTSNDFACRCCGANRIEARVVELCNEIERELGGAILTINSGYRCERHNREIGGRPSSQHLLGRAADITSINFDRLSQVCERLWNQDRIGGLGIYNNFRHIDIGRHRQW